MGFFGLELRDSKNNNTLCEYDEISVENGCVYEDKSLDDYLQDTKGMGDERYGMFIEKHFREVYCKKLDGLYRLKNKSAKLAEKIPYGLKKYVKYKDFEKLNQHGKKIRNFNKLIFRFQCTSKKHRKKLDESMKNKSIPKVINHIIKDTKYEVTWIFTNKGEPKPTYVKGKGYEDLQKEIDMRQNQFFDNHDIYVMEGIMEERMNIIEKKMDIMRRVNKLTEKK